MDNIFVSSCSLKGKNFRYVSEISDVLERYYKAGIRNVELSSGHNVPKDISDIYKFKEKGMNFIIHTVFPQLKERFWFNLCVKGDIFDRSLKVAIDAIDLLRKLDSTHYSFHIGFPYILGGDDIIGKPLSDPIPQEEALKNAAQGINIIADYASKYDIRLCVENSSPIRDSFFSTADDFLRLKSMVDYKNFGMLFDIGHMNWTCSKFGYNLKEQADKVKGHIYEIHIHENDGTYDQHKLPDSQTLDIFSQNTLDKAILNLESHLLDEDQIIRTMKEIKKRKRSLAVNQI